jgi:hypothetical protein
VVGAESAGGAGGAEAGNVKDGVGQVGAAKDPAILAEQKKRKTKGTKELVLAPTWALRNKSPMSLIGIILICARISSKFKCMYF